MEIEIHQEIVIQTCHLLYLRYQCSHLVSWNSSFLFDIQVVKGSIRFQCPVFPELELRPLTEATVLRTQRGTADVSVYVWGRRQSGHGLPDPDESPHRGGDSHKLQWEPFSLVLKPLSFPLKDLSSLVKKKPSPLQIYIRTISVKLYCCNLITLSGFLCRITLLELTLSCVFQ